MRLGGHAVVELIPESEEDLTELPDLARKHGAPLYPLGRGSNVLVPDGYIPLALVRLDKLNELAAAPVANSEDSMEVKAGAGVSMRRLLRFCLEHGLSGLEGLVGIPGSAGGAIAMNAGSFGSVIGSRIKNIRALIGGELKEFSAEDLELGYRHFAIKGCPESPIITGINLTLTRACKTVIFRSMSLNFNEKKSRQPLSSWSAGCTFKNPPGGLSAGKLLEEAGFRGRRLGNMIFSPVHANFLVNAGGGTAAQALELIDAARNAVRRRHGVSLALELRTPCIWP